MIYRDIGQNKICTEHSVELRHLLVWERWELCKCLPGSSSPLGLYNHPSLLSSSWAHVEGPVDPSRAIRIQG